MSPRRLVSLLIVVASAFGSMTVPASGGTPVVRTPGNAIHRVTLRADATGRTWRGHGSIGFANLGAGPLSVLFLRVWSNGVRGCGERAITVSELTGGVITDEASTARSSR